MPQNSTAKGNGDKNVELTGESEEKKEGRKRRKELNIQKRTKKRKWNEKMLDGYPRVNVIVIVIVSVDAGQGRQVGERDDKGDGMG